MDSDESDAELYDILQAMDSSYSEEEKEEEDYEIVKVTLTKRKKLIRAYPNELNKCDDMQFYNKFRMSKASVNIVLQMIGPKLKEALNGNSRVSEEKLLLGTLRWYATGGNPVPNVLFTQVTQLIALLRPHFSKFPTTEAERKKSEQEFYEIAKFPKTIAALDSTHVKILSPEGEKTEHYRNSRGFFSVKVQTMSDANLMITNIVARWPGSAEDYVVLKNSRIFYRFENNEFGDNIVVADKGFANKSYLVTPLLKPEKPEEILYNESQIKTRARAERCHGVWKRRFPILSLGINATADWQAIIVATAVLHNICCINKDMEVANLSAEELDAIEYVLAIPNDAKPPPRSGNKDATRTAIIDEYFKTKLIKEEA